MDRAIPYHWPKWFSIRRASQGIPGRQSRARMAAFCCDNIPPAAYTFHVSAPGFEPNNRRNCDSNRRPWWS